MLRVLVDGYPHDIGVEFGVDMIDQVGSYLTDPRDTRPVQVSRWNRVGGWDGVGCIHGAIPIRFDGENTLL